MKKIYIIALMLFLLTSCANKTELVKIGICSDGQPFDWVNTDGNIEGISATFIGKIFEQENKKYEIILCKRKTILMDLEAGFVDFIISPIGIMNDNMDTIVNSDNYLNPKMVLVNNIAIEDKELNSSYTIIYENGEMLKKKLKEIYPEVNLIGYTDFLIALQDMSLNEKVLLLTYDEQYNDLIKNNLVREFYVMDLTIENPCVIISNKENGNMISIINAFIEKEK